MNKYTIIGGGPAGLSIAYYANKKGLEYNVFEAGNKVGGNCITIKEDEFYFDSGAHRLHNKDRETTAIFKQLLKKELKEINVPSQIFINNKYVDFPITPLNLVKFLGIKSFFLEGVKIIFNNLIKNKNAYNFKDHVISIYGKKIANLFLINYSEKLWGLKADQLSIEISPEPEMYLIPAPAFQSDSSLITLLVILTSNRLNDFSVALTNIPVLFESITELIISMFAL